MTLTEEQRGTVAFDLEAARAGISHYRIENPSNVDTESALKELVDQANLAEDALAEIERLTVEHQNALDEVKNLEEQNLLRKQENERLLEALDESEKVVAHKTKSAAHWYDEYLQARADLVQTRCVIYQRDAKIKELEDALVEERTGAIRCESYDHCEGMYRIDLPDAMIRAQQELQADGKIGPDAKPRVWQITEERKAAIWHAVAVLKENDPDDEHLWDEEIAVLRAMLTEAGV